jgi:SAM-dependent methyltransferase
VALSADAEHDATGQAWRQNAARWIGNADRIAAMTAPVTDALIAALRPATGERVLDVACGAGDPALRLAARVGPDGAVLATDAVPSMLEALRERARSLGLANVDTRCAAADALDLPPGSFDAACSRFGVMFFPDPPRALAAMRRAVRTDGRLAVAAWSLPDRNPYFTLAMSALDEAGAPTLDVPGGTRGGGEHAERGLVASLAADAGWRDVQTACVRFRMRLDDCRPGTLLDAYVGLSGKVAERLDGCDDAVRVAARAALARFAAPFADGDTIALPAEALITSGRA